MVKREKEDPIPTSKSGAQSCIGRVGIAETGYPLLRIRVAIFTYMKSTSTRMQGEPRRNQIGFASPASMVKTAKMRIIPTIQGG